MKAVIYARYSSDNQRSDLDCHGADGIRTHLNATVRWTVDCRRS